MNIYILLFSFQHLLSSLHFSRGLHSTQAVWFLQAAPLLLINLIRDLKHKRMKGSEIKLDTITLET